MSINSNFLSAQTGHSPLTSLSAYKTNFHMDFYVFIYLFLYPPPPQFCINFFLKAAKCKDHQFLKYFNQPNHLTNPSSF